MRRASPHLQLEVAETFYLLTPCKERKMNTLEKLKQRLEEDWPVVRASCFPTKGAGAYVSCLRHDRTLGSSEIYTRYVSYPLSAEEAMGVEEWFRSKL